VQELHPLLNPHPGQQSAGHRYRIGPLAHWCIHEPEHQDAAPRATVLDGGGAFAADLGSHPAHCGIVKAIDVKDDLNGSDSRWAGRWNGQQWNAQAVKDYNELEKNGHHVGVSRKGPRSLGRLP
jgi:hypothetical protein